MKRSTTKQQLIFDVTADVDHVIVFDKLGQNESWPGSFFEWHRTSIDFTISIAFCGLFSILFSFCYMMQCSSHKTNMEKLSNDVSTNIKLKQWSKKKKKKINEENI